MARLIVVIKDLVPIGANIVQRGDDQQAGIFSFLNSFFQTIYRLGRFVEGGLGIGLEIAFFQNAGLINHRYTRLTTTFIAEYPPDHYHEDGDSQRSHESRQDKGPFFDPRQVFPFDN